MRASPNRSALLKYFLDYYREHMLDATTLYPGVREAFDRLHDAGVPLAVLTNKPVRFSVHLIEGLGLDLHFFRIYGGNSFEEKKPQSGRDRSAGGGIGRGSRTAR